MTKKVRLNITSIAPLGDGVSITDGSFYYVPGAVPGDEVEVEIIKRNKRDIFTKLLHVVHPSAMRRKPVCPVFERCGGCSLLHVDESLQRDAKREALKRQFGLDDITLVSEGPSLGYRRLARLHVRRLGSGVLVGFYEKRAHRIVDISACPVLEKRISDVLPALKTGLLRGLKEAVVRIASGRDGVYLHVETENPPDPLFYTESQKAVPELLAGVVLNWEGITTTVAGENTLRLDSAKGSQITLPVGSFGQANLYINNALAETVAKWARDSGASEIVELYAGAGNFSFELIDDVDAFTLIELDARACDVARQNFKGISGVQIVCDDAATAYMRVASNAPLVLLDPPRTGAQDVAREMANRTHQTVIYVSCNPATLKRDLAYLLKGGYVLTEMVGFDMFPQTAHLEVAALLKKN